MPVFVRILAVVAVTLPLPQAVFGSSGAGNLLTRLGRWIGGDWQVAAIHQAQSGFPFTISVFGDTANAGALLNVNPVRANAVPGVSPSLPSDERSGDMWFNTAAFTTPAAFTFGNVGRNSLYGPGLQKADIALQRNAGGTGAAITL